VGERLHWVGFMSMTSEIPSTPVDPDLEPGRMVGEYVVDGPLGRGAFGAVFRATQPLIGKVVAIKVLARRFSVDPEMVSRFIAEARAVNQIRHRHIIDIFSFGQLDDGRHYYVMEYLDGEPLDARIDRGRIALADALPILRGIARALDAAHAKGVAHRDLKAENVFLGRDPDGGVFPKLLDFGIAKLLAPEDDHKHKTRTGTPVGTPYYMSPEQCRGKDVDHRTDLYAFGVLAYRMLTAEYPLDADDYMSIMIRQLADQPAPPSTLVDELPRGIDDAIASLMQKDPADRPPCLRDAVGAMEAAAEHAGIVVGATTWDPQTGPEGRAYVTQPPGGPRLRGSMSSGRPALGSVRRAALAPAKRRSRLAIAIAVAGVLALAALAIVLALPGDDEPRPAAPSPVVRPAEPAPAPKQPPPRTEPAPAPRTITVTVSGVPEGTEVLVGGDIVGTAPGPVQLPRGDAPIVLVFKADGYLPVSRSIAPNRDQPLMLALKKRGAAPTGPTRHGPGKDDILDPFGKAP
jgi:serine/threonine-protein kinase